MENIANKAIVLKLNSSWTPVGYGIVADAIVDLVAGESVKALDIQYETDAYGNPDFTNPIGQVPTAWADWIKLPIRPWDLAIHSTKLSIRVPTIVIANNYHKVPMKRWKGRASKDAIFVRDGGIDQYTGKPLDRKVATMDHVIPKSRGGSNDWTNLVLTSRDINTKKGNALNSEIGLKLIRQPLAPKPIPVTELLKEIRHPDWQLFIQQ
jgi:5-methylcytosine-specific restriction endonuclease McrA